ncbi:unnamed protein product [Cochlearia groenlandica]
MTASRDVKLITIILVQAMVYSLWKERNSRFHTSQARNAISIANDINQLMCAKMIALLGNYQPDSASMLYLWFKHYDTTTLR